MEDLTSLIRYLIGASRVKYEVLENLYATIPTMQYRMGVMYVDAHSIFYRLFREKDFSTVYADSMNELVRDLVVGFFNVIGHYRRFMATRLQLDNDIYVMFNPDLPKWHEHYTDKNGWCHDKYKRYDQKHPDYGFHAKAIRKAYSFIVGLSPYFEGIYCIDSTGIDEFALMAGMGFSDDTFYTIYSRNMYCTQFVRKNVVQLVQGEFPEELSARLQRAAEAAFKLDNEMSEIREEIKEAQTLFSKRRSTNSINEDELKE